MGSSFLRDGSRRVPFLIYWGKVRIPANDAIFKAGLGLDLGNGFFCLGLDFDLSHGFFCLGLSFDLSLVLVIVLAPFPVPVLLLASFGRIGFGCRLLSIPIADVVIIANGADGLDAFISVFITCDASG